MKSTSKRIFFILLALAFVIGAVVVYSTLIKKAYVDVSLLRGELASQTDILNKFQTTSEKVKALVADLQNASDAQRQVSLILPKSRDVAYLVSQIVGLAETNGLTVGSLSTQALPVQPSKQTIIRSVGRVKADIKVSGSYAGFKSFLRQIENNILLLDVSDFKVDPANKSGSINQTLDYSISITSYYQSDK